MFPCGRALAEPSFRKESIWCVEVTLVPMDAVRMKEELSPLRDNSTLRDLSDQIR